MELPTPSLTDLIAADGFDTPTGCFTEGDWLARAGLIERALGLHHARSIARRVLEVGCGAGAMLMPLAAPDLALTGIDMSETLVTVAHRALPDARLCVADASELPFTNDSFDAVFSHSVFAYFPDASYACTALAEMHRVAVRAAPIVVLDVPDAARRDACELQRAELRGTSAASGPRQLYLERELFTAFGRDSGRHVVFVDEQVESHAMSGFRFHALLLDAGVEAS